VYRPNTVINKEHITRGTYLQVFQNSIPH